MSYQHIKVPAAGQKIKVNPDFSLNVPDEPVIPYIEGDGTGADITPVMLKVVDAAVAKAYNGKRKIHWMEVYAGEKSTKVYGPDVWMPEETLEAVKDYVVSIKARIEVEAEIANAKKLIDFLQNELGVNKIRFPETSGIGVKPVSREGTQRLVRKAIQYAIDNDKSSVTLVHKGNIMKFTEGGF